MHEDENMMMQKPVLAMKFRFGKVCDFLQEPAAAQPLSQLESGQVACS